LLAQNFSDTLDPHGLVVFVTVWLTGIVWLVGTVWLIGTTGTVWLVVITVWFNTVTPLLAIH